MITALGANANGGFAGYVGVIGSSGANTCVFGRNVVPGSRIGRFFRRGGWMFWRQSWVRETSSEIPFIFVLSRRGRGFKYPFTVSKQGRWL